MVTQHASDGWKSPAGISAIVGMITLLVLVATVAWNTLAPQQHAIDALNAAQQVQQTQIGNLTSSIQTLTNNENAQSTALGAIQNEVTQVVQRLDDLSPSAVARHH